MRRGILSFVMILSSVYLCIAQKTGYSSNFTSGEQIRNYLANNISSLDPIEGEYDVQMGFKTTSPFEPNEITNTLLFIIKKPGINDYSIYAIEDGMFGTVSNPRIERIGSTNAYRFIYGNSSVRAILENNIRLKADILLSSSDAKEFASNQRFSYQIIVTYDLVKKYPTGYMYAEASRRIEENAKPSSWTGTGFALTNNYIVTNYHVIEDAKSISIQGINGNFNNKYVANVVATDKVNDLAILKVNGVNIASTSIPYSVKTIMSEVGEDIFVLGYPLTSTMGEEIKLTTGVISSKSGFQGDVSLYQISAPIQPGNSGGPLFDSKGNVIGIVSAKHKGTENVSYAIKTSYLRNLMESSITSNILPQTNKISNLNLSEKVKSVKNFVYYIVCEDKIAKVPTPSNSTYNSNNGSTSEYNYNKYIGAANAGDAVAQHKIGRCYFHGIGVKQDYKEAFLWYRKSADNGYKSGLADVGFCYYHGYGVTKDLKQALYWYELAADKGSVAAKSWISTIRKEIQEGK